MELIRPQILYTEQDLWESIPDGSSESHTHTIAEERREFLQRPFWTFVLTIFRLQNGLDERTDTTQGYT